MRANIAIERINMGECVFHELFDLCVSEINPRLQEEFNVILSGPEICMIVVDFTDWVRRTETMSIKGTFVDFVYQQQKEIIERAIETFEESWEAELHSFLHDSPN